MSFLIHDELLRRVLDVNSVPLGDSRMIFFGVRGALPLNLDDLDFDAAHTIGVENVDYVHPRCTFVQWLPADGVLAVFPGSTVPHSTHVNAALPNRGVGVNQLMTGYYDDYRKGVHKAGSPTAHDAFRQTEGRPIRRTQDDLDFDPDDRTELTNPFDNLHAGWCPSVNHPDFASMGCQVVLGFPKCERLGNRPATGPWNVFQRNAYEQEQDRFGYMLIDSRSVQAVAEAGDSPVPRRLRFGSQGRARDTTADGAQDPGLLRGHGRRRLRSAHHPRRARLPGRALRRRFGGRRRRAADGQRARDSARQRVRDQALTRATPSCEAAASITRSGACCLWAPVRRALNQAMVNWRLRVRSRAGELSFPWPSATPSGGGRPRRLSA